MLWWIIGALVTYIVVSAILPPKKVVLPSPGPHTYHLRTLQAPKVSGLPLLFFVNLLELPLIGDLLSAILFRRNYFHVLRNLQLSCPPFFFPIVHDYEKDTVIDHKTKLTAEEFLKGEADRLSNSEKSDSDNKIFTSISDYARAYRNRKILPSEVAAKVLQTIKANNRSDTPIKAIINLNEDDVLQQARQSDERIKAGKPISIYDGVPITVKDEFDQKGVLSTCGTGYYAVIPTEDATVARKLRESGAILIGKANMHEIGISCIGFNPHHGTPLNPYNLAHHTGGSSCGSAAAVASGIVPFAVGADGGGSIRVPSSLCGVVGLKATFGRIGEHGCVPVCWTVAHAGPIASNVRDCALGYAVLAGVDPHDRNTFDQPPVILPSFDLPTSQPLQGLRIGVYSPWFDHADAEVVKSCRATVDVLQSLGGQIVEVPVLEGLMEYTRISHTIAIVSEMHAAVSSYYRDPSTRRKFGLDVRASLAIVKHLGALDTLQANRVRYLAIESLKQVFAKVDVLVTPTTSIVAPKLSTPDGKEIIDVRLIATLMRYAFLANFTGIPGISVPCGYTPDGLPIGFQIMGRWWEEHVILKVAHLVEKHSKRNPPQYQVSSYL